MRRDGFFNVLGLREIFFALLYSVRENVRNFGRMLHVMMEIIDFIYEDVRCLVS